MTSEMIMFIALLAFGTGTMVMVLRWVKCYSLGVNFPRFPQLLTIIGFIFTFVCILFFAGISKLPLQYLYACGGLVYLISVLWVKPKEKQ